MAEQSRAVEGKLKWQVEARQHEAAFAGAAETADSTQELQADILPIFISVIKPRVQIF